MLITVSTGAHTHCTTLSGNLLGHPWGLTQIWFGLIVTSLSIKYLLDCCAAASPWFPSGDALCGQGSILAVNVLLLSNHTFNQHPPYHPMKKLKKKKQFSNYSFKHRGIFYSCASKLISTNGWIIKKGVRKRTTNININNTENEQSISRMSMDKKGLCSQLFLVSAQVDVSLQATDELLLINLYFFIKMGQLAHGGIINATGALLSLPNVVSPCALFAL